MRIQPALQAGTETNSPPPVCRFGGRSCSLSCGRRARCPRRDAQTARALNDRGHVFHGVRCQDVAQPGNGMQAELRTLCLEEVVRLEAGRVLRMGFPQLCSAAVQWARGHREMKKSRNRGRVVTGALARTPGLPLTMWVTSSLKEDALVEPVSARLHALLLFVPPCLFGRPGANSPRQCPRGSFRHISRRSSCKGCWYCRR